MTQIWEITPTESQREGSNENTSVLHIVHPSMRDGERTPRFVLSHMFHSSSATGAMVFSCSLRTVPKRYILCVLGFFGYSLTTVIQNNMSIAILAMVSTNGSRSTDEHSKSVRFLSSIVVFMSDGRKCFLETIRLGFEDSRSCFIIDLVQHRLGPNSRRISVHKVQREETDRHEYSSPWIL